MFGTSMMRSTPGAMAFAANQRMAQAEDAIKALNDPMTLAIEHGIQFFTFAAAGYASGRYDNPKWFGNNVPFELALAAPAIGYAVAAVATGGAVPGGAIAGRIADQIGTVLLGTYVFKFAAGFGKSQKPGATATAPAGTVKQAGTGANFTRREITGAGAGMGALSAAEAARLSR
jgi:hypothetical protein